MQACPFASERRNVCLIGSDLPDYFLICDGLGLDRQIGYYAFMAENCGSENTHGLAQLLHELIAVGARVVKVFIETLSAFCWFNIQEVEEMILRSEVQDPSTVIAFFMYSRFENQALDGPV